MNNRPGRNSPSQGGAAISIDRPGLYRIEVDRKSSAFPVISADVTSTSSHKIVRLLGARHTPYLLRLAGESLRLAFAPAEIDSVRVRPAGVLDLLAGLERPRVLNRLTLPLGEGTWIRPLLRGAGGGRELAKATRLLTGWGFGIASRNFQETPNLFADLAAPQRENTNPSKGEAAFVIVLHIFHPELWPEFSYFLRRIRHPFHLIVTTSLSDENFHRSILRDLPGAEIITMPNRGRDIGPFLQLLHDGKLDRYPIICKLHGKRTAPKGYRALLGQVWRRTSLLDLVGSNERVESIVARFHANAGIGMIGSSRFRLPSNFMPASEAWGRNKDLTLTLAARLGQAREHFHLDFFAGTMFWARREALLPLAGLGVTLNDFPDEAGQRDGELHHTIERLFGSIPGLAGFALDTVEPLFS